MEPFSLLPFLQSLMNTQPQNGEEKSTSTPDEETSENEENSTRKTEQTDQNSTRQNAATAFLTAHEKRARNIRK